MQTFHEAIVTATPWRWLRCVLIVQMIGLGVIVSHAAPPTLGSRLASPTQMEISVGMSSYDQVQLQSSKDLFGNAPWTTVATLSGLGQTQLWTTNVQGQPQFYRLLYARPVASPPATVQSVGGGACLYLHDGGLSLQFTDLGGGGGGGGCLPGAIARTYNSYHATPGSAGKGMTHSYEIQCVEQSESGQQVVYVEWFNGQSHRFVQLSAGLPGSWQRPAGSSLRLERMANGFRVIDHYAGLAYEFGQTSPPFSKLTRISDRSGRDLQYYYDPLGRLLSVVLFGGRTNTIVRDVNGRFQRITDWAGRSVGYGYDGSGNLTSVTDPEGSTSSYSYDPLGRLLRCVNALGQTNLLLSYDGDGRVLSLEDRSGRHGCWYGGGVTLVTNTATGATTTYYVDATSGVVSAVVDPLGNTSRSFFDIYFEVVLEVGPNTNAVQYTYDSNGDVVEERDKISLAGFTLPPLGQSTLPSLPPTNVTDRVTTYTYVTNALPEKETDPLGNEIKYSYDPLNRLIRKQGDGRQTTYEYDPSGNVVAVTDPGTNVVRMAYDSWGRLTGRTNAAGQVTTYGYDLAGNLTSVVLPGGIAGTYRYLLNNYDALGRLLHAAFYAGGGRIINRSASYDAAGNKLSDTDPLGAITSYTYDAYGRQTQVQLPDGSPTSYAYRPDGGLDTVTDALGNAKHFLYDLAGRQVGVEHIPAGSTTNIAATTTVLDNSGLPLQTIDGEGRSVYRSFDGFGQLLVSSNALGSAVRYGYDTKGNLTARTNADGKITQYTYNARGALTAVAYAGKTNTLVRDVLDRSTRVYDNAGFDFSMSYDPMGRLLSAKDNTTNRATSYFYDSAGNMTNKTNPDGVAYYSYDALGHVCRIQEGSVIQTNYYDDAGRLAWSSNNNQIVTTYGYDLTGNVLNQMTLWNNTPCYSTINQYDPLGRLLHADKTLRTAAGGASGVETASDFQYDPLGRLLHELRTPLSGTGESYQRNYTYDRVGNRKHLMAMDPPNVTETDYLYDGANRLIMESPTTNGVPGQPATYGYDANGNLTTLTRGPTTVTYRYEEEGRLLSLKTAAGSRTNVFSPDGKVLKTEKWAGTTRLQSIQFEYDGQNLARERWFSPPVRTNTYTTARGAGGLIARTSTPPNARYYVQDPLGSVVQVLDTLGVVRNNYDYEAFGKGYNVSESETNFFGYAGQLAFNDDDICPRPPEWWLGWHGPFPPPPPTTVPLSSIVPMRAYAARSLPDSSLGAVAGDTPSSPLFAARLALTDVTMNSGPAMFNYMGNVAANQMAATTPGGTLASGLICLPNTLSGSCLPNTLSGSCLPTLGSPSICMASVCGGSSICGVVCISTGGGSSSCAACPSMGGSSSCICVSTGGSSSCVCVTMGGSSSCTACPTMGGSSTCTACPTMGGSSSCTACPTMGGSSTCICVSTGGSSSCVCVTMGGSSSCVTCISAGGSSTCICPVTVGGSSSCIVCISAGGSSTCICLPSIVFSVCRQSTCICIAPVP